MRRIFLATAVAIAVLPSSAAFANGARRPTAEQVRHSTERVNKFYADLERVARMDQKSGLHLQAWNRILSQYRTTLAKELRGRGLLSPGRAKLKARLAVVEAAAPYKESSSLLIGLWPPHDDIRLLREHLGD